MLDRLFNYAFECRQASPEDTVRYWFWMVVQYALDRKLNPVKAIKLAGKIHRF